MIAVRFKISFRDLVIGECIGGDKMWYVNLSMAGKYLFGGTDTGTRPFVIGPDGHIKYQGSDERVKYEIEEGLLADVSFAGSEIARKDEKSYFNRRFRLHD